MSMAMPLLRTCDVFSQLSSKRQKSNHQFQLDFVGIFPVVVGSIRGTVTSSQNSAGSPSLIMMMNHLETERSSRVNDHVLGNHYNGN